MKFSRWLQNLGHRPISATGYGFSSRILRQPTRPEKFQDWCQTNFPGFITSQKWPPYSPDLNPMDYSVQAILEARACATPTKIWSLSDKPFSGGSGLKFPSRLRNIVKKFSKRVRLCIKPREDTLNFLDIYNLICYISIVNKVMVKYLSCKTFWSPSSFEAEQHCMRQQSIFENYGLLLA